MWEGGCGCGCVHEESNSCTKTLSCHLCLSNQLFSVIAVWFAKQIGGCGTWVSVWLWGGECGEVGV